jgi:hypothetical protein
VLSRLPGMSSYEPSPRHTAYPFCSESELFCFRIPVINSAHLESFKFHAAVQKSPPGIAITNVRFGSKADIGLSPIDVRFTPKADIAERRWDVRFVPKADIHALQQSSRYSSTSSAATSRVGGIVKPIALAVRRLMTVLKLIGVCTGRSAGTAPFKIRST